ncbi:MAG: methylated-DNA--[protein]-cysteine S-methyltransferase [Halobacteriaceae archaeon]
MDTGIYARQFSYLGRYVQLGVAGQKVISVSFPESPDEEAESDHPLLDRVEAYLEGVEEDFGDVDVGLTVSGDRRDVLEAVREIPYGEQVTVESLVRMTPGLDAGSADDQDLAREALADNPAPLLVPDHRVRDGASAAPADVEQKLRSLEGL